MSIFKTSHIWHIKILFTHPFITVKNSSLSRWSLKKRFNPYMYIYFNKLKIKDLLISHLVTFELYICIHLPLIYLKKGVWLFEQCCLFLFFFTFIKWEVAAPWYIYIYIYALGHWKHEWNGFKYFFSPRGRK